MYQFEENQISSCPDILFLLVLRFKAVIELCILYLTGLEHFIYVGHRSSRTSEELWV